MRAGSTLLTVALSPPTSFASAFQYISDVTCNFTFGLGDQPNFHLPEAGPNSPGDTRLNEGNPIVTLQSNNNSVHSCNGESSSYYLGNNTWNTSFIGNDGDEYGIDIFYATFQDELWVRTLQPHMDPSLYEVLNDTIIRLNITCNGGTTSCVEFTVNFTDMSPYEYTAPYDFNDTCFHGFSTGERIPSIKVPAASPEGPSYSSSLGSNYTIILAGKADQDLPWSEGFDADGGEKGGRFWGDWWETVHRRYGRRISDDDEDNERRRLVLDSESDCRGNVSEFWNPRTGEWVETFETVDREAHEIDMFYMKEVDGMNELWVTEIESWMAPSLYNQLQYTYVKLNLTCPSSTKVNSCVVFEPRFTNWSPDIDGAMAGYRFSDPAVPTFDIPEAAPNSPGEVLLTSNNIVVTKTGAQTETYCNGDDAEYYGEDGNWYKEFIKSDGDVHEMKHVFYATARNLYAATIQETWEPNLRGLLVGRTVRIRVWCTNDERAEYLFFRISGDAATCDDVANLCEDAINLGCFRDSQSNRRLEKGLMDHESMTRELCSSHCLEQDSYAYYALQFGKECWCGQAGIEYDKFGALDMTECNYECTGDAETTCGGFDAFHLFEYEGQMGGVARTVPAFCRWATRLSVAYLVWLSTSAGYWHGLLELQA